MDFIKKHYEKVLLGVVLIGLVVAVAFLGIMITRERQSLMEAGQKILTRAVKPLPPLDLSRPETLLGRLQAPADLDFSSSNKLFNPVRWQRTAEGRLVRAPESPVALCQITRILPLYTIVTLDKVLPSDSGPRYQFGVERQAAPTLALQRKVTLVAALHGAAKRDNFGFVVSDIKGPPESPSELVLELSDTGEHASVAPDKPFQRIDGYTADMKYDPEKKVWHGLRKDAPISFGGEDWIVVAINQNEVVVLEKLNQKKWPIRYNPGP